MGRIAACLAAALGCALSLRGQVFVDRDAPPGGSGMSWGTAFDDLQSGLAAARSMAAPANPVQVWVAEGVYRPSLTDRSVSFDLADHVEILGGFAGNETMASQRDPAAHPTILSGDLMENDPVPLVNRADPRARDNTFHVVLASGVDETAVIDGFVIRSGVADGTIMQDLQGAGLLVAQAAPTIRGCRFEWNLAAYSGGGVCVLEGASAMIESCTLESNFAGTGGGLAVLRAGSVVARDLLFELNFSFGDGGAASMDDATTASFANCRFRSNEGSPIVRNWGLSSEYLGCVFETSFGTALYIATQASTVVSECEFRDTTGRAIEAEGELVDVADCIFEQNGDGQRGGALYMESKGSIVRSVFRANWSGDSGGAVYADGPQTIRIDSCLFEDNSAQNTGGALYADGCDVFDCDFVGNDAASGGAVRARESVVERCRIEGNSAVSGGGGASLSGSEMVACDIVENQAELGGGVHAGRDTLTGCRFERNTATTAGGGLMTKHLSLPRLATIRDCIFVQNSAPLGGALHMDGSDGVIEGSEFVDNSSTGDGGAISSILGEPSVARSAFHGNSAAGRGGGVHLAQNSDITLVGCLFSGNGGEDGGGLFATEFSDVTLVNTTLVANSALAGGGGIHIEDSGVLRSRNTILWGNADASGMTEAAQATVAASASGDFGYSALEGWSGSFGGAGNHGDDPLFADELGPDLIPGSGDEDLRLVSGSPCVDAGSNHAVPAGLTLDLDGLDRFADDPATPDTGVGPAPVVDMGAYELPPGSCYADCEQSTGVGVLDIFDFLCFQDAFIAGDPYACDCDIATGPGLCDIFDFVCFQDEFVGGCP